MSAVPATLVADILSDYVARERASQPDPHDGIRREEHEYYPVLETVAARAGVSYRTLTRWASGGVAMVPAGTVDRLLVAIDRLDLWYTSDLQPYYS